ncbi:MULTISPECIES: diaminobutyrate acetyltransferase [unclassified Halomonas]|uniref:diaminobutyrate acetyltransferase n=1 Tax=unclassified Halomonas TaxID=2609666 RepID=UPI0009903C48|nr:MULTISPECIES: diaminobutyrate acetyltransferase [unclassified Halomonas]AQU81280.1 diaminobutyrate acetyltransferase [Halomonas sp. 'Soap Lake \
MSYIYMHPSISDATSIYHIAQKTPQLDSYPEYFYLLWCRDFKNTSLVAKKRENIAGFIIGYLRPDDPQTLLLWQQAMSKETINKGIGIKLLYNLTKQCSLKGTRFIEATIDPSNKGAEKTLKGISKLFNTKISKKDIFDENLFSTNHHKEVLVRIGPLMEENQP